MLSLTSGPFCAMLPLPEGSIIIPFCLLICFTTYSSAFQSQFNFLFLPEAFTDYQVWVRYFSFLALLTSSTTSMVTLTNFHCNCCFIVSSLKVRIISAFVILASLTVGLCLAPNACWKRIWFDWWVNEYLGTGSALFWECHSFNSCSLGKFLLTIQAPISCLLDFLRES